MLKLVLFIVFIAVLATLRLKFDLNYTLPAIKEDKDLSLLMKIGVGAVIVILVSMMTRQYMILVISLVIGVPILLYLNVKAFHAAIRKFLGK